MQDACTSVTNSSYLQVKIDNKTPEEVTAEICETLRPRVYVVVSPLNNVGLGRQIGGALCGGGKKPVKYTLIDTQKLQQKGKHSEAIETQLTQVEFTASAPDELPISLWTDLYKEAFAKSPNPLGNFIIVNFPTACAPKSFPSVRDQFNALQSICSLAGIVFVKCSEDTLTKYGCDQVAIEEFSDYLNKVEEYIDVQYGKDESLVVFKTEVDFSGSAPAEGAALHAAVRTGGKKIAADFLKKQDAAK